MDRRGRWGGVWEFKRSSPDLIYDAAGEEGGRFLAVRVEVQRHQGVGAHGEVVVHGQDLRQTHRQVSTKAQDTETGTNTGSRPLVYESRLPLKPPELST